LEISWTGGVLMKPGGEMEKVRKIEEERAIGKYILKNKLGLLIE